jgi:WD40 repeat protein
VGLLAYTDGLLYLADLVTGQLRRINSPDFVRRLVLEELPKKEADAARVRGEDQLSDELREIISHPRTNTFYGIKHAVLTPDGRYAVTGRDGEAIRVWDATSGECVKVLPIRFLHNFPEGEVQCMVPMSDSEGVVFVTQDGRIHIWRFLGSAENIILPRNKYNTSPQICLSADGKKVVFGGWFDPIEVWDILELRLVKKFDQKPGALVHRFALSGNGAHLVVATGSEALNNEIVVWNLVSGIPISTYPIFSYPAQLSIVSDDGKFVCITDNSEIHYLILENATTSSSL